MDGTRIWIYLEIPPSQHTFTLGWEGLSWRSILKPGTVIDCIITGILSEALFTDLKTHRAAVALLFSTWEIDFGNIHDSAEPMGGLVPQAPTSCHKPHGSTMFLWASYTCPSVNQLLQLAAPTYRPVTLLDANRFAPLLGKLLRWCHHSFLIGLSSYSQVVLFKPLTDHDRGSSDHGLRTASSRNVTFWSTFELAWAHHIRHSRSYHWTPNHT